ncbi:MAG: hypothetical protein A2Y62_10620 [Candidatus Fischerbacteria bacterium RBG_13_37_8]|uniref:DUF4258 domain-containing protein n=1 Tax=Candidatus Fischerbacteria bacterium RBG_13_37_8 TaxID=1817863 RepID=A0A1F5VU29_9BACT|nr:MAG: hypothetical protein A2Y62_10620 [Candidatus Fischerbacteria bacterium RBG_13_37_8]
MDKAILKRAIKRNAIEWQRHALERMMERGIYRDEIMEVLLHGEIIEDYPDDKPYPSALILGCIKNQPFHVVVALDSASCYCFIITAYKPDIYHFESNHKTRRQ